VLFDKALARRFDARLKHAGQLVSKSRYLAAPWIGLLETGAWTTRAAHANAMARKLASLSPFPLAHPVEANAVFLRLDRDARRSLKTAGWRFETWIGGESRFMCSWATTDAAVEELGAALKAVA
jgi:threonine aldolase